MSSSATAPIVEFSPTDPNPDMDDAQRILEKLFGYKAFRLDQAAIIETLLAGGDALALMPTGGGKSLCYQIPALARSGTGIVVSPLIALMQDQVDALRVLGLDANFLNSSQSLDEQREVVSALRNGMLDLLYIAPERLVQERTLALLDQVELSVIAIDEAHCVSQWGHDFRPEYRQLSILAKRFPNVPRIALTATADTRTRQEILDELSLGKARKFVASFDRPNICYTITETGSMSARERLWRFIEGDHATDSGIVYCLSRRSTEETAAWLKKKGRQAVFYHAGMSSNERRDAQTRFLAEDGLIVTATNAFGMGIDKPDVRFVAHLTLPKTIEAYYQETGRAGRDGSPANAWMAYGLQDIVQQRQWIAKSDGAESFKIIQNKKLDALIGLAEMAQCRRQALLLYFGEEMREPCGNCDNCISPPETIDATRLAQMALSTVFRTEQRFGVSYLVNVLLGKVDTRITQNGHDKLSVFGIGRELEAIGWRSLFRQLTSAGYLVGDLEGYGTLALSGLARPLLRGETTFTMRAPAERVSKKSRSGKPSKSTASAMLSTEDRSLFDALKDLRRELAAKTKVPPFVICHDKTLVELARKRPEKLIELNDITGLGAVKIKKYGRALLEVISHFHDKPQLDNNLSATINATLALHLEGNDVETISQKRELDVETILEHFAEAIEAGVLQAEDVVDLDGEQIDEIHGVFEELAVLEKGDVGPAYRVLNEKYSLGVLKCLLAEIA